MITAKTIYRSNQIMAGLPQTEIGPGRSITVGLVSIDLEDSADLRWLCLHLIDLEGITRSAGLVKASRTGSTVTADSDFFLESDVKGLIQWTNGHQALIESFTSATQVEITTTGLGNPASSPEPNNFFTLTPTRPYLVNDSLGVAISGLQPNHGVMGNLIGGIPPIRIELSSPGVIALRPTASRVIYGPDVVAIVLINNTVNFNIQASVTSGLRYQRHA